jgi:hypothetical protein
LWEEGKARRRWGWSRRRDSNPGPPAPSEPADTGSPVGAYEAGALPAELRRPTGPLMTAGGPPGGLIAFAREAYLAVPMHSGHVPMRLHAGLVVPAMHGGRC